MQTAVAVGSNILGIDAKSVYIGSRGRSPGRQNEVSEDQKDASAKARTSRYRLLRTAQGILYRPDKSQGEQYRVIWCGRCMKNKDEVVGVRRAVDGSTARFTGVSSCGCVWHCAPCACKISEKRREELDKALSAWVLLGNVVQLLTLTFPHARDQSLAELVPAFGKAMQKFKASRTYKAVFDACGRAGSVRSLETTWGENGWHPHTHDLVFLKRAPTETEVDKLKAAWVQAIHKSGLCPSDKMRDAFDHGLDIQDGSYAAEYIAKFGHDAAWGMSAEMTKPHSKVGRMDEVDGIEHYTPFQLLAWAEGGDDKAAALFKEFCEVFHGKRMLSWSPGLRKLLDLGVEISDEMILANEDQAPECDHAPAEEVSVGVLTVDQFHIIVSHNNHGEFLEYIQKYCTDPDSGQTDIDDYVAALAARPATHRGTVRKRRYFCGGFDVLYQ